MVFPIPPQIQSRQRIVNTLLMYVTDNLEDKSYARKK